MSLREKEGERKKDWPWGCSEKQSNEEDVCGLKFKDNYQINRGGGVWSRWGTHSRQRVK